MLTCVDVYSTRFPQGPRAAGGPEAIWKGKGPSEGAHLAKPHREAARRGVRVDVDMILICYEGIDEGMQQFFFFFFFYFFLD